MDIYTLELHDQILHDTSGCWGWRAAPCPSLSTRSARRVTLDRHDVDWRQQVVITVPGSTWLFCLQSTSYSVYKLQSATYSENCTALCRTNTSTVTQPLITSY